MKTETNVTFSQRLLGLMSSRGLGNASLAKAVGVSHVAIGNYVDGRLPRAEELLALARHFGVSTDYLLGVELPTASNPPLSGGLARSSLRDRLKTAEDVDAIPKLYVITGSVTIEELEEAISKNVAEMRKARAENKPTYLKLAALYLTNLHERLNAKSEVVPERRETAIALTEEAPAGSVRLPPQVVSVAETLPNVHPGARDRVRAGALVAMRLAREKVSSGKGTAGGTSGSTSLPSPGSPSARHP